MNAQLQKTLDNLDAALTRLVDSISMYNPQSSAARELIAAEEALTNDLAMVAEHQALYAKLQDLNVLSESLDQKTVDLLQSLETVHAELLALPPAPTSSEPIPPVPYEELLDYAKKISKFTPTAQLARGEEDFSGQKKDILAAEEINFLRQQRGSKVWPFPDEGKMKGGALGWLATGGEYKRENEKK